MTVNLNEWLLEHTWCDRCQEADLGMHSSVRVEADGHIYVDGKCKRCGGPVRSEIVEKDAAGE